MDRYFWINPTEKDKIRDILINRKNYKKKDLIKILSNQGVISKPKKESLIKNFLKKLNL